ncbi:metal ABC transporter permease [Methanococcoides methylutens]|uniref:Zinc ABC transporter, inner membrane permease protein ZnuB n=1 Tax=Methanococcoides methylutens MM1 TaxID=1434104 RepID=A0A0E3SRH2_METMT|nr:metal ABC transporter permease [Methanococcoides methylutens]AKB85556.1 Zinc ABC transporter, inner membrane permease protein ZnuB [Methanococcoides methylutens MM1]
MIELLQYEFMRNAIFAGMLASIACGIIGVYVVVKKIVFISGGIAHASFGGIGIGYFLGINPIFGVLPFSLFSALTMGTISKRSDVPEDTIIGILWSLGMAIGIIFIGWTPGYAPDLMTYLFGNILTVPGSDIYLMLALDVIIIGTVYLLYKEFMALCYDEEFSRVSGVPTEKLYLLLLCLIALTVVVMIRVVGLILVIALLTIPAALSRQYTSNMKVMMYLSILFGTVFTITGLILSYYFDIASGATIIIVMATAYLLNTVLQKWKMSSESISES